MSIAVRDQLYIVAYYTHTFISYNVYNIYAAARTVYYNITAALQRSARIWIYSTIIYYVSRADGSTAGRKRYRGRSAGWSRSGGYIGWRPYNVYTYIDRHARPFYRRHGGTGLPRCASGLARFYWTPHGRHVRRRHPHKIFYIHIWDACTPVGPSRLLVAKGYAALFTLEI